ncbi:hypothetical protein BV22DRAFT_442014 [Leucogyrophana mollusca]|uniref:Uncharacterized protein n=1 Tax=Leucogyrophana mollusca TaxID=85980 RepID=A0ACB8BJC3_9AGAM|nr:hypothetical protein BV22DRAFT_442014 [Leucogyrophana mollusca]
MISQPQCILSHFYRFNRMREKWKKKRSRRLRRKRRKTNRCSCAHDHDMSFSPGLLQACTVLSARGEARSLDLDKMLRVPLGCELTMYS